MRVDGYHSNVALRTPFGDSGGLTGEIAGLAASPRTKKVATNSVNAIAQVFPPEEAPVQRQRKLFVDMADQNWIEIQKIDVPV